MNFGIGPTPTTNLRPYILLKQCVFCYSSVLWDVKKHYYDRSCPHPPEELLYELAEQLDAVGLSEPASKIYITTRNVRYFPLLCFLFTITHLNRIIFVHSAGECLHNAIHYLVCISYSLKKIATYLGQTIYNSTVCDN